MPDAFHVFLLAVNALILSATMVACSRSWRAARRARGAAVLACADSPDARRAAAEAKANAERLDLPSLLPFTPKPVALRMRRSDVEGAD